MVRFQTDMYDTFEILKGPTGRGLYLRSRLWSKVEQRNCSLPALLHVKQMKLIEILLVTSSLA